MTCPPAGSRARAIAASIREGRPGSATSRVNSVRTLTRLSIQYFTPAAEAVWNYQVGGYQVCEKWLKDRQERRLELEDIRTYCRIDTALGRTVVIQTEIDALYPGVEKSVVATGHMSEVKPGSPDEERALNKWVEVRSLGPSTGLSRHAKARSSSGALASWHN